MAKCITYQYLVPVREVPDYIKSAVVHINSWWAHEPVDEGQESAVLSSISGMLDDFPFIVRNTRYQGTRLVRNIDAEGQFMTVLNLTSNVPVVRFSFADCVADTGHIDLFHLNFGE